MVIIDTCIHVYAGPTLVKGNIVASSGGYCNLPRPRQGITSLRQNSALPACTYAC